MGRISPATREEIEQAYARGLTTEQIVVRLGVPYKTARAVWRAMEAVNAEGAA